MSIFSAALGRTGLSRIIGGANSLGGLTYDTPQHAYVANAPAAQAQFVSAGESKVGRDAGGETAQRDALARMRQISDTGYSDIDRSAMASADRARKASDKTAQTSVLRNAQRRGTAAAGGGDLSAALIAGQGSANRLAEDARQVNAQGQQRRTDATGAMNDIGGQLTSQQMGIGQAQNQQNQANAQMQNQVNMANATGQNANQNLQYQGANQSLQNQASMQQQTNMANTGYNQQMFGAMMQPVMRRWGSA